MKHMQTYKETSIFVPFFVMDTDAVCAREVISTLAFFDQTTPPVLVAFVRTVGDSITLVEHRDTLWIGDALPACRDRRGWWAVWLVNRDPFCCERSHCMGKDGACGAGDKSTKV